MSGALAIFGPAASAVPMPAPSAPERSNGPRTWWNSVSPSQIVAYRTCPRKWYSASILGDREPSKGFQLRGDAIHKALEVYMSTGEVLPSVTMKDPNSPTGETTFSTLEFVQVARQHLPPPATDAEFWAPHRAQDGGPLVEQAGEMATFPGGPNFVQFIDLVIAFGKTVPMEGLSPEERYEAGTVPAPFGYYEPPARAIVNDYKTSSDFRYAKTPEELAKDVQLNANAKWLFDVSDYEEIFVRHLYLLTKTVHPKSKISGSIVTRASVLKIWERDMATVREMQGWAKLGPPSADALPPNTESCEMYGGCYYKAKCFGAGGGSNGGSLFSIRKPIQSNTTALTNGRNMDNAPSTPSKGGLLATLMARAPKTSASGPAALGIAPTSAATPVVGLIVPAPGVKAPVAPSPAAPPNLFAPAAAPPIVPPSPVTAPAPVLAPAVVVGVVPAPAATAAPALFAPAAAAPAATKSAAPKPCDTDATHAGPCADPMCYVRSMDGIAMGITPPDAPSPISTPEEVAAANAADAAPAAETEADGMEPAPAADTTAPTGAAPVAPGAYSAAGKRTRRTKAQMEAARAAEAKAKEDALNGIVAETLGTAPAAAPAPETAAASVSAPEAPTETEQKLQRSIDIVAAAVATDSVNVDVGAPVSEPAPVVYSPTAEPAPAGVSAVFGVSTNEMRPPTAPSTEEVSGDLAQLREKLSTPDAAFECPVQALFIDCMPAKGWPGEAPKSFTDLLHAFEAAAASSAKALDYRLIRYESKGWLAVAIRVMMRGLPEAVYLDSRIPGADVFESVIAPYARLIVRGTR